MSKPAPLDTELYGDIYGDDEELTEFHDGDLEPSPVQDSVEEMVPSPVTETQPKKPQDSRSSLPQKPVSGSPMPSGNGMSYSAQIAQQFSAYQQTPSQERQQRQTIPLPDNPRTTGAASTSTATGTTTTSAIATHESSTTDSVFGKKPSEMHDSGRPKGLFFTVRKGTPPLLCARDRRLLHVAAAHRVSKVDACTIMRDPSGTSRGFAFLTFEDADAVNLVIGRDHVLDGKPIDPKRAIPREEHLRNTRYFVGGLAPTTTAESMKEFFGAYGKVVDATVMVDRESGRSKGFGFVTYEDATNADQLVGKLGLMLDDKQIEVKMAQPRSQRDQARASGNTTSSMTMGREATGFGQPMQSGMATNAMGFTPQQQQQQQQTNQMGMMFNRPMGQVGMMGGNMPMMNMNPMAMAAMGMGMGGFNPMAGGMNGMNMMGGMGGMAGMAGMGNMGNMNMGNMGNMGGMGMGNMGGMRLGMGPMGMGGANMAGTGMVGAGGMTGMNQMGMVGMRNNMMGSGMVNPGMGRSMGAAAVGPGPARATSRGQHSFHPYSR
ncbi:hypothetical protein H0H92_015412 [Tricholoma furcatifolium]|nr:hypothetical protein H0H92_015412 [Tricholoma furcatifolium]